MIAQITFYAQQNIIFLFYLKIKFKTLKNKSEIDFAIFKQKVYFLNENPKLLRIYPV